MTRASVLAFAALLCAAAPARAQEGTNTDTQVLPDLEVHRQESPRNWVLALKLGFYHPNIDAEPGADSSFNNVFSGKNQLFTQATIERLLFKGFGSIGLGVGIGYSEFYGHSVFANNPSQTSSDVTSFHTLPFWGQASYRFDVPARRWNIPLVPYGTIGAGGTYWWTGGHNGTRAGYLAAAGLQLLLNPIDPRLARDFDEDVGVNDTYLFVEYANWSVKGNVIPGQSSPGFDLSDHVLSFGLAFEF